MKRLILDTLAAHGPLNISQIKRWIVGSHTNRLSAALRELHGQGYVANDQRTSLWRVTCAWVDRAKTDSSHG